MDAGCGAAASAAGDSSRAAPPAATATGEAASPAPSQRFARGTRPASGRRRLCRARRSRGAEGRRRRPREASAARPTRPLVRGARPPLPRRALPSPAARAGCHGDRQVSGGASRGPRRTRADGEGRRLTRRRGEEETRKEGGGRKDGRLWRGGPAEVTEGSPAPGVLPRGTSLPLFFRLLPREPPPRHLSRGRRQLGTTLWPRPGAACIPPPEAGAEPGGARSGSCGCCSGSAPPSRWPRERTRSFTPAKRYRPPGPEPTLVRNPLGSWCRPWGTEAQF